MKFTKLATVSALTLALAGTSMAPAMADEKEPVHQETVNLNDDTSNPHEEYNGNDVPMLRSTPLANYSNVALVQGTFTLKFQIAVKNKDIRYYVKNRGNNSFSWKILDPKGNTWSGGSLNPGESGTWTALGDIDYIPVGEYTFAVTSHNGGSGAFDFSARALD